MNLYDEMGLPDPQLYGVYAEFWRVSQKDLLNLKKYLTAKYVDKNSVSEIQVSAFKDGVAALLAHFESCLRLKERGDAPQESKDA